MPRPENIKKALEEIKKRTVNYEYFFDNLKSPDWIEPLYQEGMFQKPPLPIKKEDYISFPFWPESRYLVRMAPSSPELILEIILKIPETENTRVQEDIIDATLAMPANLAAKIVTKAKGWIDSPYPSLLPEKMGALVAHLARSDQVNEALDLARVILTLQPESKTVIEIDGYEDYNMPPEPKPLFEKWYYEQILEKYIPVLVTNVGEDALTLLCDVLESAIQISMKENDHDGPEDGSFIWRPAIEEHSQNYPLGPKELLVSVIRDAAETLIEIKGKPILDIIEKRRFKIFHRISLHLRRKWPEVDPKGTAKLTSNPDVLEDVYLHHEFYHLLQEQFNHISPEAQNAYLSLVKKGYDVEEWLDIEEKESGQRPSQEEGERSLQRWKYNKLLPIQAFLDTEWLQIFNQLKKEFGEFEHPDFHFFMGPGWVGPTSPKGIEELRSMKIEDLISFLKTWKPSKESRHHSPEGLRRELTALVTSDPNRFVSKAEQFQELDPTYVRALLLGLHDVAKKKDITFRWSPVLELCQWVMGQPRDIPERRLDFDSFDSDWVWTRHAIADLLSAALESGLAEIPFNLRDKVWKILKPLTDDPDPTKEYEATYGGSNMDPAMLSINTTRGEAMHAVVRYALWVRRYFEKIPDGKERIQAGFNEMPEVREVLNHHLDPNNDPALSIRAVYGQWFPWLVKIDKNWTADVVTKIFPKNENLICLHETAWETYIAFCRPYDSVFELLQREYEYAIDRIGTISAEKRYPANPDERLAEHLLTFYWQGKLNLDEPDGLLEKFYVKAPDPLCAHALDFIGRNLRKTEEEVPSKILDRLRILWEHRFKVVCSEKTPESHNAELSAFGWWFASGKFDTNWSIEQLEQILKITGQIGREHWVIERLVILAPKMPDLVVKCLRLIIEDDKEGWHIYSWKEQIRNILTLVLKSNDETAQEAAEDLVNRLGARGFLEFRDLLSE